MKLRSFFRIVEIKTKIVSVSTFSIAVLYGFYRNGEVDLGILPLMFAAVLFVDMGTTAFNIFFDYWKGVDHQDYQREEEKVLVYENVPPYVAFLIGAGLFFGAVVFGAVVSLLTSLYVAFFGAVCMGVGYFYTAGPYPISRSPFGELFAGGFLGTVLFLITYYVVSGHRYGPSPVDLETIAASGPSFFLIASILTVNNTCDILGDAAAGRKTLSIVLGKKRAELLIYLLGFLGFVSALLLSFHGVFPRLSLIPLVLAAIAAGLEYRKMHQRGFNQETKAPSMGSISKIFLLYTGAMWISLIGAQLYGVS
ncbi:MAG TPA: prenyltransferase [Sediminispirochaeta sp.]|nr:prenyltransferase [Sediminispirochaeta sp.]